MNGLTLKALCTVAATALFCGTALAQDTTAGAENEPSQDVELPTGEPVGPKIGEPYEREQIVDWTIRCIRQENPDEEVCQMYQLLKNTDGSGVAEVSLVPVRGNPEAAAAASVMTPLGTMLRPGLVLAVDTDDPLRFPFTVCSQQGCLSRFGVTDELLEKMKSGNSAVVEIVAAVSPDRPVFLDISLSGFTRAYEVLLEQDAKRP